jgi:hypothetical protein
MRWVGHVLSTEEIRNSYKILIKEVVKGSGHLEDITVKRRKRIFLNRVRSCGLDLSGSG